MFDVRRNCNWFYLDRWKYIMLNFFYLILMYLIIVLSLYCLFLNYEVSVMEEYLMVLYVYSYWLVLLYGDYYF